jgi:uncharacterized protein YqhQ
MSETRLNVGGQAVLEGVMMRSPHCFSVAVRRKGGQIVVREQPWRVAWASRLARVPFVRGAVTLFESMQNGYSALRFSAEQMEQDLGDEPGTAPLDARSVQAQATTARAAHADESSGSSGAGTRLATVIAVLLFIAVPQILAWLVGRFIGPGLGLQDFWFHALTGVFKLALVLGYLTLIRRVPEVRRVFQYHGAEHKAIATYEAGEPLTVEYARTHSTRHARCGTTFLIVVILVSVLAYAAVLPPILRALALTGVAAQIAAIGIKVLIMPLIAGFAYELQRVGARFSENPLATVLLTPGYWVQGITTIEPDDTQLEIALASLQVTLAREAAQRAGTYDPPREPVVQTFSTFNAFAAAYAIAGYRG